MLLHAADPLSKADCPDPVAAVSTPAKGARNKTGRKSASEINPSQAPEWVKVQVSQPSATRSSYRIGETLPHRPRRCQRQPRGRDAPEIRAFCAAVLTVRIHLPPAGSHANHRFLGLDNIVSEMVRGGAVHPDPRPGLHDPLVSQIALTIVNQIEDGVLDNILADALSTTLAVRILRHYVDPSAMELSPPSGLSRERLQRVRDYIDAHLGDRLTLTDLAGVACLSLYHFSRSFKLALGIGPQRYVVRRRLKRAKTLMRRTNQPLAWVAQEAGFA